MSRIDLAGLAIAGGLYIVPTFAAVQAWAGADRRARVIAGVNVLNAAFMASSTVIVALLQVRGIVHIARLFVLLGLASLGVAILIGRTMPASALSDALSIIYRALFRIEVNGLENLHNAGPNVIIALNHVSFLDAALAMSLRSRKPVFAIDVGIAKLWWVKPFLKLTRALPLDPMKPMATRTLINAVKGGEALIIFPEGRITVTGSLMKVYDGAAMIADKADAEVVPVRIEGLEQTPFSRLSKDQVRRKWFPKVKVTILEPVKLAVDPALKGRQRRQAAGAALYGIMSDLVFRTTSTDRTVVEAVIDAAKHHGRSRSRSRTRWRARSPTSASRWRAHPRRQTHAARARGPAVGVMLPNANGAVVTVLGLMSAGRVPAMINFSAGATNMLAACKAAEFTTIVTSRAFVEKGRLGNLDRRAQGQGIHRLSRGHPPRSASPTRCAGCSTTTSRWSRASRTTGRPILFTSGSEGVPKGVVLSHRNMLANAAQAPARIDFGRQDKVFNALPIFHSFGLTVGVDAAARLRRADLSLPFAAALSDRGGAGLRRQRHHHVRHRHLPLRLCAGRARLRFPFAALHPCRRGAGEGLDAQHLHGQVRPAHPRRLWRHRDGAGARAQHADVQQARDRRAHPAWHGGAAREGRGRGGGRPAASCADRT